MQIFARRLFFEHLFKGSIASLFKFTMCLNVQYLHYLRCRVGSTCQIIVFRRWLNLTDENTQHMPTANKKSERCCIRCCQRFAFKPQIHVIDTTKEHMQQQKTHATTTISTRHATQSNHLSHQVTFQTKQDKFAFKMAQPSATQTKLHPKWPKIAHTNKIAPKMAQNSTHKQNCTQNDPK